MNNDELQNSAAESKACEAGDILTHQTELEVISADAERKDLERYFSASRASRILVYEESADNIIGAVHREDFYNSGIVSGKSIRELISPVVYVIENEPADGLFSKMQNDGSHVSVVLDEYGGIYGIVTIEDFLEKLPEADALSEQAMTKTDEPPKAENSVPYESISVAVTAAEFRRITEASIRRT